uniref:Uncharacterized protein n=1 Tax=Medicago truncatula TaxID=3880 RepID=I3SKT4_MEDTR|nr:unknown [Medicago truncatula]
MELKLTTQINCLVREKGNISKSSDLNIILPRILSN